MYYQIGNDIYDYCSGEIAYTFPDLSQNYSSLSSTQMMELGLSQYQNISMPQEYYLQINSTSNKNRKTNWGTYITGTSIILTTEDMYNNFIHNHITYVTTRGVTKNIYKANGAIRSARAGQFATTSKIVKWTGIAGTAFMTGVATYHIIDDVSNKLIPRIKYPGLLD